MEWRNKNNEGILDYNVGKKEEGIILCNEMKS